ncbi:MAG: NAD(P)H-hydrate dehydratase, partial [Candidatus Omnitrophica bacterium]|nr:NAD(P)H-hydrate dehydratase [Candidatus Omnitrophota bacterium]
TPHPKEMARLLDVSTKKVQSNRRKIAELFSRKYKITLALKGYRTIVSDYSDKLYINKTGNPGMATAGSGDVLTGMIASFLGQGLDAFTATKTAVYLHGLAGDIAAREKTQISLIASDIIAKIPCAIKKLYCWRSSVGRAPHL